MAVWPVATLYYSLLKIMIMVMMKGTIRLLMMMIKLIIVFQKEKVRFELIFKY